MIHWINNLPRLVLMLMPLNYGLLNILPIHLTGGAILELVRRPAVTDAQHRLVERGSRRPARRAHRLGAHHFPDLNPDQQCSWSTSLGFRVTPKHQSRDPGGSWALALPLLLLTALNAANLAGLLQQLGHGEAWRDDGRFAGLAWGLLNLLGTLTALRACWDPPMQDPAAWLAVDMAGEVLDAGGHRHPCRIKAISDRRRTALPDHVPPGEQQRTSLVQRRSAAADRDLGGTVPGPGGDLARHDSAAACSAAMVVRPLRLLA